MKIITPLSGAVAVRFLPEDILASTRLPLQDLLSNLSQRYSFMSASEVGASAPIVLANGKLGEERGALVIPQLQLHGGGYVVFSSDTTNADRVLDDMIKYFEEEFRFTIRDNIRKRSYLSSVVVEFDGNKPNIVSSLSAVEALIERSVGRSSPVKRLAFGEIETLTNPLDEIEKADFLIERRLGSETKENRFFSTAPLQTDAHMDVLKQIEDLYPSDAFD